MDGANTPTSSRARPSRHVNPPSRLISESDPLLDRALLKSLGNSNQAKKKRNDIANSDFCGTCNDGGHLLCCDGCIESFHLDCCDPPLTTAPEGDWFCKKCCMAATSSPAKSSSNIRSFGTSAKVGTQSPRVLELPHTSKKESENAPIEETKKKVRFSEGRSPSNASDAQKPEKSSTAAAKDGNSSVSDALVTPKSGKVNKRSRTRKPVGSASKSAESDSEQQLGSPASSSPKSEDIPKPSKSKKRRSRPSARDAVNQKPSEAPVEKVVVETPVAKVDVRTKSSPSSAPTNQRPNPSPNSSNPQLASPFSRRSVPRPKRAPILPPPLHSRRERAPLVEVVWGEGPEVKRRKTVGAAPSPTKSSGSTQRHQREGVILSAPVKGLRDKNPKLVAPGWGEGPEPRKRKSMRAPADEASSGSSTSSSQQDRRTGARENQWLNGLSLLQQQLHNQSTSRPARPKSSDPAESSSRRRRPRPRTASRSSARASRTSAAPQPPSQPEPDPNVSLERIQQALLTLAPLMRFPALAPQPPPGPSPAAPSAPSSADAAPAVPPIGGVALNPVVASSHYSALFAQFLAFQRFVQMSHDPQHGLVLPQILPQIAAPAPVPLSLPLSYGQLPPSSPLPTATPVLPLYTQPMYAAPAPPQHPPPSWPFQPPGQPAIPHPMPHPIAEAASPSPAHAAASSPGPTSLTPTAHTAAHASNSPHGASASTTHAHATGRKSSRGPDRAAIPDVPRAAPTLPRPVPRAPVSPSAPHLKHNGVATSGLGPHPSSSATGPGTEPLPPLLAVLEADGMRFDIHKPDVVLGRGIPDKQYFVDVDLSSIPAATKVSKKHAIINLDGSGRWLLTNYGKNGTTVDSTHYEEEVAVLHDRSVIKVGGVTMLFTIASQPQPPA